MSLAALKSDLPLKSFEELTTLSPSSPYCAFTYHGSNLGDHIQTLALLQHLTPRLLVPRDYLVPQKDLCLIANGWLSLGDLPKKEDFKSVKYVGVHITPDLRNVETVKRVMGCGVIGSRDSCTHDFLTKNGAPSRLTYCATLTFPRYYGVREGVYCIDIADEIKEKACRLGYDPRFDTHDWPLLPIDEVNNEVLLEQYRKAYTLLLEYRTAELVITSRLHVTLPCLAFGTPVIYLGVSSDYDDRITILDQLGVRRFHWRVFKYLPAWALRKPHVIDISKIKERYLEFLHQALRIK